ncbi:MAG: hypothetical protein RJQ01_02370 [Microcella sp.]|uniref:hypothetical protein n=1 Tax=Microcella sp. TaxID=1913979 RepID=UPI003315EBEF
MTRARWAALGMAVLLALYLVLITFYAVRLVTDPLPIVRGIGWALIVLPLLGAWALVVELRFGIRAERLARLLEQEGGIPGVSAGERDAPDAEGDSREAAFARYSEEVREQPDSWQSWFRLGLAYDASRDRARARWAVRTAIKLERQARQARQARQSPADPPPHESPSS